MERSLRQGALGQVANTMDAMNRDLLAAARALALLTLSGVLISGCGSQTKTVSLATSPPATASTATTTATRSTPTTTTSTQTSATTPTSTAGGTPAPTETRTAPEPKFTEHESGSPSAANAAAVVREHGYTPNSTAEYHSGQTLTVLIGTRTGSSDGYDQLAFFFLGGKYIGTDTKQPSAQVKVLDQSDTEVTLGYPLYRKSDPLSSPSGGEAHVTFQLNNGKLVPLGKIPPAESSSGPSRQ
jgi:hypothetical protein